MPNSTLILAIYLAFFAALHSFLASLRAKRYARQALGSKVDTWYMTIFSLIALITILPLVYLLYLFPGQILYVVPTPWRWLMICGQVLTAIVSTKAFLDAPHRFKISAQLSAPHTPEAGPLAIRGVYRWIRDPFLLSGLIIIWLTPFMTVNLLILYILTTLYLYMGSLHWERRLVAQFGTDYRDYEKQVPRMIPRRKRYNGEAQRKI